MKKLNRILRMRIERAAEPDDDGEEAVEVYVIEAAIPRAADIVAYQSSLSQAKASGDHGASMRLSCELVASATRSVNGETPPYDASTVEEYLTYNEINEITHQLVTRTATANVGKSSVTVG